MQLSRFAGCGKYNSGYYCTNLFIKIGHVVSLHEAFEDWRNIRL